MASFRFSMETAPNSKTATELLPADPAAFRRERRIVAYAFVTAGESRPKGLFALPWKGIQKVPEAAESPFGETSAGFSGESSILNTADSF